LVVVGWIPNLKTIINHHSNIDQSSFTPQSSVIKKPKGSGHFEYHSHLL